MKNPPECGWATWNRPIPTGTAPVRVARIRGRSATWASASAYTKKPAANSYAGESKRCGFAPHDVLAAVEERGGDSQGLDVAAAIPAESVLGAHDCQSTRTGKKTWIARRTTTLTVAPSTATPGLHTDARPIRCVLLSGTVFDIANNDLYCTGARTQIRTRNRIRAPEAAKSFSSLRTECQYDYRRYCHGRRDSNPLS